METAWPKDMLELREQKVSELVPKKLANIGDLKAADCIPVAEAILQTQLPEARRLEGSPLYFNPTGAAQGEKGNLDRDTSNSTLPFNSHIRMYKVQGIAINFPKNALNAMELKKAVEFGATHMVEKVKSIHLAQQMKCNQDLTITVSPAEVEFEQNPKDEAYVHIHVFCKIGFDYKKKEVGNEASKP